MFKITALAAISAKIENIGSAKIQNNKLGLNCARILHIVT
jgi:hypothetical protein